MIRTDEHRYNNGSQATDVSLNLILDFLDKSDDDFYTGSQKTWFVILNAISVILPEVIVVKPEVGLIMGAFFTVVYNIMQSIFNYQNGNIFHV